MTNTVVCRVGTGELAAKLADEKLDFTGVKLVGADPVKEIVTIRNTQRGFFLSAITLDSEQENPVILPESTYYRMATLYKLQSLILQRVDCPASSIKLFTNLTHLELDRATDDQIVAISSLSTLTSLHVKSPLEERHIRCLKKLNQLTELIAPFRFPDPYAATLTVAQYLPALKLVENLPCSTPLSSKKIQELFKTFQYKENALLKRVFSLQDTKGCDLFHYCREALESENPDRFEYVLHYINNETTSEEQLLAWLDYSLTSPLVKIFEKVLSCQVDVNKPLSDNDRALVVAVQGDCVSKTRIFEWVLSGLMAKGANPSLCDGHGNNPLIIATKELRSELVKKMLSTGVILNPTLVDTVLELAITAGIDYCSDNPENASRAFSIVTAVCTKRPSEVCLTAQLERIFKAEVPIPSTVVETLLKAGAKTNVKNGVGNTALNELLRVIGAMDKAQSKDQDLWEVKFASFKLIIENGDDRIKDYKQFLAIARHKGVLSVLPFLESKMASQIAKKSAAKK